MTPKWLKVNTKPFEVIQAIIMLITGVWLLLFDIAATFPFFPHSSLYFLWGVLGIGVGVARLSAIVIGNWGIRLFTAYISSGMLLILTGLFLQANPQSMAVPLSGVIMFNSFFIYLNLIFQRKPQ